MSWVEQGNANMTEIIKQIAKNIIPSNLMTYRLNRKASNSILLTFDDGPHETITPLVLECLEKYKVRAIFFVVGRFAQKNPYLLEMIERKGHCIANHSYEHPNDRVPGFLYFRKDIIKCQNLVKDICGKEPRFYRPPGGLISPKTLLAAKSVGLRSVLWSNAGGEWAERMTAEHSIIAKRLLETLSPRDIVLLHDNNPKVPKILDIILPFLTKQFDLFNAVEKLIGQW